LKTKPDIIHIHNIKKLTFSVIFLAKIFKIPVVASIYDYWYFCLKETLADRENKICFRFHGYSCTNCLGIPIYFKYPLKLRKIFINFFLNRIDAFIVLSKSSSEIMQRYGIDKEKINIIYQPSSLNGTLPEESPVEIENPCLLFVGNLTINKGALIAIESFVSIRRQIPNVRLYIVGVLREYANKKYVHTLTQILKQHKLESSVFFLDRLTPGKIYSIFRQSDLVIVPEQWPNMSPAVLMEAMIMAKPIVASKIGGIPEFIRDGENGLLADPRDPAEFAKKVIWILKNPEEAKKMGEKAKIDACKIWEDDTNIKKIIEIYDSLLEL